MASSSRAIWTLIGVETTCLLGSEISRFGISVWIFQSTQSVAAFSALLTANVVPGMLARPIAGSIVDRTSRKLVMIAASIVALAGTLTVLAGALLGELSMPLVLAGASLASIAEAFQWPALSATIPLMAAEEDLPRYNGFLESGRAAGRFAGPAIGGFLFAAIGVAGLVSIELVTFTAAIVVVTAMHVPRPEPSGEPPESLLADSLFGARWILAHKPLLKFLLVATFANFFVSMGEVVMQPYGLSMLDKQAYGIANGLFGAGMIVGGLLVGPLARRYTNIQQFLGSALFVGAFYIAYGFSRDAYSLGALNFGIAAMMTISNASIMTIWQLKVPDDQQGRVFSTMQLVADVTTPISFWLAAPIADGLMPMGTLFSLMGVILVVGFSLAWAVRDVRLVEELPV